MTKQAAVREALAELLAALDSRWPEPFTGLPPQPRFFPGYSRAARRVAPSGQHRYNYLIRHLETR